MKMTAVGPIFLLFCVAMVIQPAQGQTAQPHPTPDWQTAAGGTRTFEVASIRLAEPGGFIRPNIVLNNEDTPVPPSGRILADFPLEIYIEFAYKIMPTHEHEEAMLAHLPKWVAADHYVIQARAEGNPTKDQVRLMMQSLLADRFKLAVHFETRIVPVLALVLDKPGKIGPGLRSHADGPACDTRLAVPADRSARSVIPCGFMPVCGRVQALGAPNHTILLGARNISLEHLAGYLPDFEDVGRPLVDKTGLSGTFDFSLDWLPEQRGTQAQGAQQQSDGPSFLEALKEQLGLRLKPGKAPVEVLVIDHVEKSSPN
jgi:uncharacterized protein (TIGR03435 family)